MSSMTNFQATLCAPDKNSWPYEKYTKTEYVYEQEYYYWFLGESIFQDNTFFENDIIYKLHIELFNLISRYLVEV